MVETVAPTRSRRLPFWAVLVALMVCVLGGVFVLLWIKLPAWAPEWVVDHSPWVDPVVRAAGVIHERGASPFDEQMLKRLVGFGPAAVPWMIDELEYDHVPRGRFACEYFSQVKDPRVIRPLFAHLETEIAQSRSDRPEWLRGKQESIHQALLNQEPTSVATALIPVLAAKGMSGLSAIELAGRISDERLIPLLARIIEEWDDLEMETGTVVETWWGVYGGRSATAAFALVNSPVPSAIPAFLPAFSHKDPDVRMRAVCAVVRYATENAAGAQVDDRLKQALYRALDDEDFQIRRSTMQWMAEIQVPGAEEKLMTHSQSDDVDEKLAAIHGLGAPHTTKAGIERLAAFFRDESTDVQLAAVRALDCIGKPEAIESLFMALDVESASVRKSACRILLDSDRHSDERIRLALERMLHDPDQSYRRWAERMSASIQESSNGDRAAGK